MKVLFYMVFFGIGLVQTGAMFAGFMSQFGRIFGFILSLVLGQIPIIGGIMGIIGSTRAWDWPWWGAALLFFVAPLLCLIIFSKLDE